MALYTTSKVYNSFFLALLYGLALFVIQFFFAKLGLVSETPNSVSLLRYDAGIYENISRIGYEYPDKHYNNTGAFLLFAAMWHLLHVGITGISIVNIVLFSVGFAILCELYPTSTKMKVLWLSTPSLYFMIVPYTEALFFMLAAFAFYGIEKEKKWLIWVALFLLSLTRATALFLLPGLLLMELIKNEGRFDLKQVFYILLQYAAPILTGLTVFVVVQYSQTGVWFAYFKQQATALGHKWAIPTFPLNNFLGGPATNWLAGLALFVSLVAFSLLLRAIFDRVNLKRITYGKVQILSFTYLAVTAFSVIFFSPTWGSGTTNLTALHRYTFATPFFFVFMHKTLEEADNYKLNHFTLAVFLCNLSWLCMGSYIHIQHLLFWNVLTLLVAVYMLYSNSNTSKKHEWAPLVLVAFNAFVQVSLFQRYLNNIYTD